MSERESLREALQLYADFWHLSYSEFALKHPEYLEAKASAGPEWDVKAWLKQQADAVLVTPALVDGLDEAEAAVERAAMYLEGFGIRLDPDAGTETGDAAEYLAHQILAYIGELQAAQHAARPADAGLPALDVEAYMAPVAIQDASSLTGGWPEGEDLDGFLANTKTPAADVEAVTGELGSVIAAYLRPLHGMTYQEIAHVIVNSEDFRAIVARFAAGSRGQGVA